MELTNEKSIDSSPTELLSTEILQKILSYLPVHDRIRVERVCKRWKNVAAEGIWKDIQVLQIIGPDFEDGFDPFEDLDDEIRMVHNKLYINVEEIKILQSIVSRAGPFVKEFIFDPYRGNTKAALSIIAAHCHNIESIRLYRVDDSDIEALTRLLEVNKQLHSIACRHLFNFIETLPLRNWKSLSSGGLTRLEGDELFGIEKEQWEEKVIALIENSPSLEKFHVYDWTPNILTAISNCKQLNNLIFPIWNEEATNGLMMNISLLNRLTRLTVQSREDKDDTVIINLLRQCVNLESLGLYYEKRELPSAVIQALLALPKLESLEVDVSSLTSEFVSHCRSLKLKHLRLQGHLRFITESEILEIIRNSEDLEELDMSDFVLRVGYLIKLAQDAKKRRKVLKMKIDTTMYEMTSEICEDSKIQVIAELNFWSVMQYWIF